MIIAYLDANSGSLIVSAVAAGLGGIVVAVKFGWRRLTRPLRRSGDSEASLSNQR